MGSTFYLIIFWVIAQSFGISKISQFANTGSFNQDIRRFNIPVNNIIEVEIL